MQKPKKVRPKPITMADLAVIYKKTQREMSFLDELLPEHMRLKPSRKGKPCPSSSAPKKRSSK